MSDSKLVKLLNQVADAYELEGVEWKPAAYRKAASSIQHLDQDVATLHKMQGIEGLTALPGVGKAIAEHIVEYIETGHIKKLEKLLKQTPPALCEIMQIEGMGPKKASRLIHALGLTSVADLRVAAKEGKVRGVEGFGEKTEKNILSAIQVFSKGTARRPLAEMQKEAENLVAYLTKHAKPERIDYAGSIRRRKDTVGDIDILVQTASAEALMSIFTSMPAVERILAKGPTKSSVVLDSGIQVDVRVVAANNYAAALMYFTGSREHSITLRTLASKKGYLLSEYGLFKANTEKQVPCNSEKSVYAKLGLKYIPPELREGRGEFDAARKDKLPQLIELADLKGDLHMHTTFSDGNSSLQAMIQQAQDRGYAYIAITDHSRSARIAHGLDVGRLRQQWQEIDELAGNFKIRILKGAEVDILKDGNLDYPDAVLEQLHVVVGAIHSSFKLPEKAQTKRVITALSHPLLDILAHPSCRLISKREQLQLDFTKIFEAAAANKKILEINCQPNRMDLHDGYIFQARKLGIRFCISTDAHHTSELAFADYGVGLARRGWLTKNDVINTGTFAGLRKYLPRIPK